MNLRRKLALVLLVVGVGLFVFSSSASDPGPPPEFETIYYKVLQADCLLCASSPLPGATVHLNSYIDQTKTTDSSGLVAFVIPTNVGFIEETISAPGFQTAVGTYPGLPPAGTVISVVLTKTATSFSVFSPSTSILLPSTLSLQTTGLVLIFAAVILYITAGKRR